MLTCVAQRRSGPAAAHARLLAAHEIGHSLIGERIGAIANQRLPRWIREGVADTIGFGGEVDIDGLTRRLIAGDRELDPKLSGFYKRYRLLVAFFLQREGWSIDRLLASNTAAGGGRAATAGRGDDEHDPESGYRFSEKIMLKQKS